MLQVIYDDQCGFCIRSLKVCRALDVGKRLAFHGASTFRLKPDRDPRAGERRLRERDVRRCA